MASPQPPSTPRLPTPKDFPSSITLSITAPPSSQPPLNVLLLLHGLGDTDAPFHRLGQQLKLPYTCVLSLRGPTPVPALMTGSDAPSFHWGDDILFDPSTGGELDPDAGFAATQTLVADAVIARGLLERCGFRRRDILLLGFGQGAMAALHLAALLDAPAEYAGVVAVGGRLPAATAALTPAPAARARTPILLLGGSRSRQVTRPAVEAIRRVFAAVEYVKWAKAEDSMPGNREEMLPIMRFFARRLRSREGVPEGAVEIG
ncbi:MAG: hypothetical protein M1818_002302 [Claussenomyces sp. TS43310]|nr:MAG: hypothetical protein M1818_002302 [Claussenomyces sp. TS43310]